MLTFKKKTLKSILRNQKKGKLNPKQTEERHNKDHSRNKQNRTLNSEKSMKPKAGSLKIAKKIDKPSARLTMK